MEKVEVFLKKIIEIMDDITDHTLEIGSPEHNAISSKLTDLRKNIDDYFRSYNERMEKLYEKVEQTRMDIRKSVKESEERRARWKEELGSRPELPDLSELNRDD